MVLYNWDETPRQEQLQPLAAPLGYRGPDATGYWTGQNVGLVHTRLSILDLTERANQPLHSPDGKFHVVFNGEVYNYPALKTELEQAGYSFVTTTDTEVLLHGYHHWGLTGLVQRLDGMFAFALYDRPGRCLHLARDRFGKKPLLYSFTDSGFVFSSDVRSLLNAGMSRRVNPAALDYYLTELAVPQPMSLFSEASHLPPAHTATLDLSNGNLHLQRYWQLEFRPRPWHEGDALQALDQHLEAAVRKRLLADVPVGAFLSGGVDSGLVVAYMARVSSKPVRTFSVGFSQDAYNELPEARRVAQRYGTHHTELMLEADTWAEWESLLPETGEPFADASLLPTYLISRAIRQHVTVALSGDGGDELFGGYYEYERAYWADRYRWLLRLPSPAVQYAKLQNRARMLMGFPGMPLGFAQEWHRRPAHRKLYREMGFAPEDRGWVRWPLAPELNAQTQLAHAWNEATAAPELDRLFQASLNHRLLNDYLVKVDRASMFASLEVRSPLLDVPLAEFAATLPGDLKLQLGHRKYLLKRLAQRHTDPEVFTRRKQGFALPLADWLRGPLRPVAEAIWNEQQLAQEGVFDRDYLNRIWQEHQQATHDHTHRIWALLVLDGWWRRMLPTWT
jgi:asparagine synthase (glutamine-hydrolysing)